MNLANVRAGIATRLATITSMRVYDTVPLTINPPAAVIALADGTVGVDFNNALSVNWTVIVLLSRVDDDRSQAVLDAHLSTTGTTSILAAIAADQTLSGSVDAAVVVGWDQPSTYTIAGIDYVGVELTVEVIG